MTELPLPCEAYDMGGPAPLRYVLVHGVGGDRTQWRALAETSGRLCGTLVTYGCVSYWPVTAEGRHE
jgi:hypothetical protein